VPRDNRNNFCDANFSGLLRSELKMFSLKDGAVERRSSRKLIRIAPNRKAFNENGILVVLKYTARGLAATSITKHNKLPDFELQHGAHLMRKACVINTHSPLRKRIRSDKPMNLRHGTTE
jgi:hypothetical protein